MPWNTPPKPAEAPIEITPRMIRIYRQMKKLQCTCTPRMIEEYAWCSGCLAWRGLNWKLSRLLPLPVWEFAVVPDLQGDYVDEAGALARRAALEQALAESS